MTAIPAETAVHLLMTAEDNVLTKADLVEKPVNQLREDYTLPVSRDEWANTFASRMVMMNKEYRRSVRQVLQGYAHHYELLFPRSSAASNPMKHMLSLFVETVRLCNEVRELHAQFQTLYTRRCRSGLLFTLDRAMVLRALDRMQFSLARIDKGETAMREQLAEWKSCFMLVFMQNHLTRALEVLQSRKIAKKAALSSCAPLFAQLSKICGERLQIVDEASKHATVVSVLFMSASHGLVPKKHFNAKVEELRKFEADISSTGEKQDEVIRNIYDLVDSVWSTPATLPGPDGAEIPFARLRQAGKQFEKLRIQCTRTQELARPTLESFKTMLADIGNGPSQIIIAVQ